MSDGVVQDTSVEPAGGAQTATAGSLLQQARMEAGIHIAALAAALKVPVYKLEALEANRLDVFPDAVFVRALASTICRTLKVDAAPILALLPSGPSPHLPADRGINATFKDGAGKKSRSSNVGSATPGSRWVPLVVVVLLGAALALIFLPRAPQFWPWGERSETSASAVAGADHQAPPGMVAEPVSPGATGSDLPATPSSGVLAVPSAPASADTAARPDAAIQPPAGAASVTAAASDVPSLLVRARGETWVQIRSITSGTSAQRVLQAGETLTGPGAPPWAVVIGKSAVTDVVVRGVPFDLSAVAKENVARFEVK